MTKVAFEQLSVIVSVRPLTTIYDVQVKFRMNWTTSQTVALNGGVPSIQVFDEGQDLVWVCFNCPPFRGRPRLIWRCDGSTLPM